MSPIKKNIISLKKEIAFLKHTYQISYPIDILASTKYATFDQTQEIIDSGITLLGENKIQDLVAKRHHFNNHNVTWHMIGHLQSNKINKALDNCSMIQSIDSIPLMKQINKKLQETGKFKECLLQVNIGNDPNKFGFSQEEIKAENETIFSFSNIVVKGIMVVTPKTDNAFLTEELFKKSKDLFTLLKENHTTLSILSMGMSGDFQLAIKHGATQIRIGRQLLA